ncbi:hypothetical protein QBC35DRAFT_128337 [Podospora australis]|uniref:Uncharacterized protein n=1 Tax=Podospora australis TaxID=1536484 RepID=A0AAN6X1D9_9PEZI|nr:hypothetical protein QBC35DRAFT_128337 [Podospora australis]
MALKQGTARISRHRQYGCGLTPALIWPSNPELGGLLVLDARPKLSLDMAAKKVKRPSLTPDASWFVGQRRSDGPLILWKLGDKMRCHIVQDLRTQSRVRWAKDEDHASRLSSHCWCAVNGPASHRDGRVTDRRSVLLLFQIEEYRLAQLLCGSTVARDSRGIAATGDRLQLRHDTCSVQSAQQVRQPGIPNTDPRTSPSHG